MPNDFRDLTGSEFERADMSGARFTTVLLNAAVIRNSDFHQVVMRGVEIPALLAVSATASLDGPSSTWKQVSSSGTKIERT